MDEHPSDYIKPELMACCGAREIRDGDLVIVGTGFPTVAANIAKLTHAPRAMMMQESGVYDARPKRAALSVGDPCLNPGAAMIGGLVDIMAMFLQAGWVDVGFLSGSQVDKYGNINTTVIGPYEQHKTRLPGSGGANDVGSFSQRTIIIMRQDKRKFVEKVDFITTPGYLTGPGAREAAGLPKNTGPYRVITQLGVYGFHPETKRMMLLSLHHGVTLEEAKANASFEFGVADRIEVTEPPSEKDIRILHEEIDPVGIVLKK